MARIVWTRQSEDDLVDIRAYIARNSPQAADAFVARLIAATERLEQFPFSGEVVPELNRESIREIIHPPYRIIYRVASDLIEILTVYHSARLLGEELFDKLE